MDVIENRQVAPWVLVETGKEDVQKILQELEQSGQKEERKALLK